MNMQYALTTEPVLGQPRPVEFDDGPAAQRTTHAHHVLLAACQMIWTGAPTAPAYGFAAFNLLHMHPVAQYSAACMRSSACRWGAG
jgi:hypothetical protein